MTISPPLEVAVLRPHVPLSTALMTAPNASEYTAIGRWRTGGPDSISIPER